jgi:hypothetical protein
MLEQATSPAGGFWQTRQPSVHSRQAGSGGTKVLAAGGPGDRGGDGVVSVASACVGQSANATVAPNRKRIEVRAMAASLPSAPP